MTRDKIIKGLIRGYSCDDEDDCNLSCHDCIHQKFSDYERQIRADAIDEFADLLLKKCWAKLGALEYVDESEIRFISEQLKEKI